MNVQGFLGNVSMADRSRSRTRRYNEIRSSTILRCAKFTMGGSINLASWLPMAVRVSFMHFNLHSIPCVKQSSKTTLHLGEHEKRVYCTFRFRELSSQIKIAISVWYTCKLFLCLSSCHGFLSLWFDDLEEDLLFYVRFLILQETQISRRTPFSRMPK